MADQDLLNPPVINAYEELENSGNSKQSLEQALQDKSVAENEPAPVQEEPKKEEDPFSSKFAALSRKEKELRDMQARFEQERQAWEENRNKTEEEFGKYKQIPDRLKNEPLKFLEEHGLTVEDLASMALNEGNPTPELQLKRLRQELETDYKTKIEELEKKLEETETKRAEEKYNETIENFKYELNQFIDGNKDTYELIHAQEAQDLVYDVIDHHFKETGRVLSNEEAAKAVETYLENEARDLLGRVKKLSPAEASGKEAGEPGPKVQSSQTLSNTQASQVPNRTERKLSDRESLVEAAKLIRWED